MAVGEDVFKVKAVNNASNVTAFFGLPTFDGISFQPGDYVLLASQTDPAQDGIYQIQLNNWIFVRNSGSVIVKYGTKYGGSFWSISGTTWEELGGENDLPSFAQLQTILASFPIPTVPPTTAGQGLYTTSATTTAFETPIGGQVAYTPITANWTYSCTAATWTSTVASGTAPSVILPDDGFTYRIVLRGTYVDSATSGVITVGLGISTTDIYTTAQVNGNASQVYPLLHSVESVIGAGQTVIILCLDASTATVTFGAAATALGPAEMAAYRVK